MYIAGTIIGIALQIFLVLLIVRAVLSWIPVLSNGWQPTGATLVVFELIFSATDPLVRPLERHLPVFRIGGVGIPLGFLVAFLIVYALMRVNGMIFF